MKIKRGIILAAGIGSRLLPLTKSIPKPMLPVVNKPVIDYIIDEALQAGIKEIAVVCNHKEEVIIDYLKDKDFIHFIHQNNTFGTSYALKAASHFITNEPFSLFLGDEIVYGQSSCIGELIEHFEPDIMTAITGIEEVTEELLKEYNCVSIKYINNKSLITTMVEKPKTNFLSNFTSIGRYIISGKEIFPFLNSLPETPSEEVPLTEYFKTLIPLHKFYGHSFTGKRFDIGTKDKWLNTNIEMNKLLNLK